MSRSEGRTRYVFAAGLLVAVAAVGFLPVWTAGFIWDDPDHVHRTAALGDLAGLARIWTDTEVLPQYYPMTHTVFWLEHAAWGLNPTGYHGVNLLLHVLNALLLWRLLSRLRLPGAYLAAMLFAIHPVTVETVAWVSELKNLLSTSFYLLAAHAYFRYERNREGSSYALTIVFFLLAILSKTVTVTFPVALLIVAWWKRGRWTAFEAKTVLPMFVPSVLAGLTTAWIEKTHVGASGAEWALDPLQRVLLAGRALGFYLGKLALPVDLTFNYPRWNVDPGVPWQWGFPVVAAGVGVALWLLRRRLGRGPLAAALFFVVTLSPALGFFDVFPFRYAFVADHFQYLAAIGPIALVASLWGWTAGLSPEGRRAATAGAGICIALLVVQTFRHASVFRDAETLWVDTLGKNERSWLALNHLGLILQDRGDHPGAIELFSRALTVAPGSYESWGNRANSHLAMGQLELAVEDLTEALRVRPDLPPAYFNRAVVLEQLGDLEGAVRDHTEAIRHDPDHTMAYCLRARCNYGLERYAEALSDALRCRAMGAAVDEAFLDEMRSRAAGE